MAATAIGTYAALANVKALLGITDTTDDTVIQSLCDQANMLVESRTQRILAPLPAFSTTTNGAVAVGATTVILTSVTGLAVNDALMLGPVAGTHESALVTAISGSTVTLSSALVNAYASGATAKRVYVFDGFNSFDSGKTLEIPMGIVSVTSLEVATFSAGAGGSTTTNVIWYLLPGSDYNQRPTAQERQPGWPAGYISITNVPTTTDITPAFFPGYNNVRIDGSLGWGASPDEVIRLANNVVVGTYRLRGSGGAGESMVIGSDGSRTIERLLTYEDRLTLSRYTRRDVLIV